MYGSFLQFRGRIRQEIVVTADSRLCTGKIGEQTTLSPQWRKWTGTAALEWKKIQGGIPLHEMYIFDTQEKNYPRNTEGFLLSHGKLRSVRVSGKAWTFSGTVCVDPWWVQVGWQRRPGRNRKIQSHGSRRGPQTARCNQIPVCTLRYITAGPRFRITFGGKKGSCARKCRHKLEFLVWTLATVGFLTLRGVLFGGACEAMRSLKKPSPRYSTTHFIMEPVAYGLKCSSKATAARWGASTRAAARPGRVPRLGRTQRKIIAVRRIEVSLGFVDHLMWKWVAVENCQR